MFLLGFLGLFHLFLLLFCFYTNRGIVVTSRGGHRTGLFMTRWSLFTFFLSFVYFVILVAIPVFDFIDFSFFFICCVTLLFITVFLLNWLMGEVCFLLIYIFKWKQSKQYRTMNLPHAKWFSIRTSEVILNIVKRIYATVRFWFRY